MVYGPIFLFNTFYALKDLQTVVSFVTGITDWQIFWLVISLVVVGVILWSLRGLFKKFHNDAEEEERELAVKKTEFAAKKTAIKNKYS